MEKYKQLKSTELQTYNCVILNEYDRPSGNLVAVILGEKDGKYICKYLNKLLSGSSSNMLIDKSRPVPVSDFGVDVYCDPSCNAYWCEKARDSVAKYRDGSIRLWQENVPFTYVAVPSLLSDMLENMGST